MDKDKLFIGDVVYLNTDKVRGSKERNDLCCDDGDPDCGCHSGD